uniref:Uncharacterized protein n=1 Tax=Emiliania huxleyi (strain CCMP1516) TaxID=280463 RepID=A0A0D3JJU8_EMIH1
MHVGRRAGAVRQQVRLLVRDADPAAVDGVAARGQLVRLLHHGLAGGPLRGTERDHPGAARLHRDGHLRCLLRVQPARAAQPVSYVRSHPEHVISPYLPTSPHISLCASRPRPALHLLASHLSRSG